MAKKQSIKHSRTVQLHIITCFFSATAPIINNFSHLLFACRQTRQRGQTVLQNLEQVSVPHPAPGKIKPALTTQDRELSVHTGFSVCKVCLLCISADLFLIMQHSVLSNCVARLIWFGLRLMVGSSWRGIRNARWRSLLYVSYKILFVCMSSIFLIHNTLYYL